MSDTEDGIPAPRAHDGLVGHEAAQQLLLESWNAGRMPHAWLITGRRGIGKATLAYRVARFVLAQGKSDDGGLFGDALAPAQPDSLALAPDHPVAARVASGGHPDLRVLEPGMVNPATGRPSRQIVVSQVRQAVQFTNMTSAEDGWRVVLVDPADELNASAQNAILKSLEEPPPMALFLLVSNAPGRLLPTIRSRCRRLALDPLPDAVVEDLLAQQLPDLSPEDRAALARLADGSIGDATALEASGGLELYRTVLRLMETLDSPDVAAIHALGDSVARAAQGKPDPFATLRDLMDRWLARLVLSAARREPAPEIVPGEAGIMAQLQARAPLDQWMAVWEKVTGLLERADRANLDRKQTVVSAFLTLASLVETGQARAG